MQTIIKEDSLQEQLMSLWYRKWRVGRVADKMIAINLNYQVPWITLHSLPQKSRLLLPSAIVYLWISFFSCRQGLTTSGLRAMASMRHRRTWISTQAVIPSNHNNFIISPVSTCRIPQPSQPFQIVSLKLIKPGNMPEQLILITRITHKSIISARPKLLLICLWTLVPRK